MSSQNLTSVHVKTTRFHVATSNGQESKSPYFTPTMALNSLLGGRSAKSVLIPASEKVYLKMRNSLLFDLAKIIQSDRAISSIYL